MLRAALQPPESVEIRRIGRDAALAGKRVPMARYCEAMSRHPVLKFLAASSPLG